jgi:glycosyltransferase involved in cell wall biosynthesis
VADVAPAFRNWLDKRFAGVYRQAQSRFCVSPAMGRTYEKHYGAQPEVIYPSRAADCPLLTEPPARLGRNDHAFTVAFAGTINSAGYVRALVALQNALKPVGGRLMIFGPLTVETAQEFGLDGQTTEVRGLLPATELIARLRNEADALFVPMSFEAADRVNMEMAFPSKLADYTATGLPLLIYGPRYCSAVMWARENPGVAEVVDVEEDLGPAVEVLANNPDKRIALGKRALVAGREYFTHDRAREQFYEVLSA